MAVFPGYGGGGLTVKFVGMVLALLSAVHDASLLLLEFKLLTLTNNPTGLTCADPFVLFLSVV